MLPFSFKRLLKTVTDDPEVAPMMASLETFKLHCRNGYSA